MKCNLQVVVAVALVPEWNIEKSYKMMAFREEQFSWVVEEFTTQCAASDAMRAYREAGYEVKRLY